MESWGELAGSEQKEAGSRPGPLYDAVLKAMFEFDLRGACRVLGVPVEGEPVALSVEFTLTTKVVDLLVRVGPGRLMHVEYARKATDELVPRMLVYRGLTMQRFPKHHVSQHVLVLGEGSVRGHVNYALNDFALNLQIHYLRAGDTDRLVDDVNFAPLAMCIHSGPWLTRRYAVARWAYRPGRRGDARCGCERWPDRSVRGSSRAAVRTLRQQPPISPWKPGSGRESLDHRCLLPQDAGMAIQELVWDMDGTLLDTTVVVPAAFVRAVRKLGGRSVSPDRVVAAYSRGTPEVILAHLVGRDLTVEETEVYYTELQDVEVAPYPGVVDVMRALREQGRVAAVFTGASSRAAAMLLKAAGLDTDVLVGGDHVPNPKPAADGLLLAAAQVGVEATALAYVGDSPLDLRTAAAAGSHRAAASWGHMYDGSEPADSILARPEQALDLFELSLE